MHKEKTFDLFFLKSFLKKEKNYMVIFIGSGPFENILKERIKENENYSFYLLKKFLIYMITRMKLI